MIESHSERRSKNIKVQIVFSFLLKFLSMSLGFLVIPKTLNILGENQYGIWLTILSIVSWIITFDVGIGNGLRNKLSESLAANDYELSCKYISTGYLALAIIGGLIIIIAIAVIPFVNWNEVFNTHIVDNLVLQKTMLTIIVAVILNFVITIVDQVMNAFQLSSFTNIGSILHSSLFLAILLLFDIDHDLLSITKLYSICLLVSSICVSLLFYSAKSDYFPKLKWVDISKAKDILTLGGSFFIIQIATIFMFSMANMLTIQLLTPKDVSVYNITFRLFSALTLGFSIIITPYWSAFTEAHKRGDFNWIKKAIFRLHILLLGTVIASVLLIVFHQKILDLWLGNSKIIPGNGIAISFAIYAFLLNWSNIYSHFLNGIGVLKMQTIVAIVQGFLVIPLCILFTKQLNMGLLGIVLSMVATLMPFAILGPLKSYKILKTYNKIEK